MTPNVVSREQLGLLGLTAAGTQYVLDVRDSPPSRKVGRKRRRNLILEVPMRCVHAVLQAESLTGEYCFLLELDRRNDVVAVFDQPITVKVEITDCRGRQTRTLYTADYLVVYESRVCAIELKADGELSQLVKSRPQDWQIEEGCYRYLPAERLFGAMGIDHVVIPNSAFNTIRADNIGILNSVRDVPDTKKYRKARIGLMQLLQDEKTMLLADILERVGDTDATPILQLIGSGELFADLDNVTLSDPASVWVSVDPSLARTAQEASAGMALHLDTSVLDDDEVIDPHYALEVATRLLVAQGLSKTGRRGKLLSERTIRRHRSAFARSNGKLIALQPKWANCGNHELRVSNAHQAYLTACIREGKRDPNHSSISQCFERYKMAFDSAREDLGFYDTRPVVRSTFYSYFDRTSYKSSDSYHKGGRRLENADSESIDPKNKSLVVSRPFAVAHIDHWKCDFFLVVGVVNGKVIVARPWLTAMVDAFSGEVLAVWLSFANPSRRSCTMVIRDCVRRHNKLPEMIIVDGGSDFRSVHFQVMLATLDIIRCERPPEDPRFGQEVERLFGAFKERFARGLPGFGISIEKSRAVSASFKSQKRATLSLLEGFNVLEAYVFQGYNHSPKPGENSSRYAMKERALRFYPHCGRPTEWDLRFLIATSIEAPGSGYTLWPGRGLHVNDNWYTSSRLAAYRGYKKDLIVRLEPYADSVVYVYLDGKWMVCLSSRAKLQFAMAERSLLMATAERSDLRAVRKELENEMTRCAASIVNQELEGIAKKRSSHPVQLGGESSSIASSDARAERVLFSFDDIEPYANDAG